MEEISIIPPEFRMFWKSFNVPLASLSVSATVQFPDTHQLGDFFVLDVSKRQSFCSCLWRWDRAEKKEEAQARARSDVTTPRSRQRSGVLTEPGRRRRRNSRL